MATAYTTDDADNSVQGVLKPALALKGVMTMALVNEGKRLVRREREGRDREEEEGMMEGKIVFIHLPPPLQTGYIILINIPQQRITKLQNLDILLSITQNCDIF